MRELMISKNKLKSFYFPCEGEENVDDVVCLRSPREQLSLFIGRPFCDFLFNYS